MGDTLRFSWYLSQNDWSTLVSNLLKSRGENKRKCLKPPPRNSLCFGNFWGTSDEIQVKGNLEPGIVLNLWYRLTTDHRPLWKNWFKQSEFEAFYQDLFNDSLILCFSGISSAGTLGISSNSYCKCWSIWLISTTLTALKCVSPQNHQNDPDFGKDSSCDNPYTTLI